MQDQDTFLYVSELPFLDGSGIATTISVCLNCGKLQGKFPISDAQIKKLNT